MREASDDHPRRSHVGREWERPSDSLVLAVVCIAQFMVVVDTTIVNVALRNIQLDLGLSQSGLTWVINAYAIPFAGFLLLGGDATPPSPATAAQMPSAFARRTGSVNAVNRIVNVAGERAAAPSPCTARALTSWPRLVARIGARCLVGVGSLITAVGLVLLSTLEAHDDYVLHIGLPASLTVFGLSTAYIPATFAASGVDPQDAGLASGLVNSTRTIGGSLGLAAMASIAAARTHALSSLPADIAQTAGCARGFAACAVPCVVAAIVGWTVVVKQHGSTVASVLLIE